MQGQAKLFSAFPFVCLYLFIHFLPSQLVLKVARPDSRHQKERQRLALSYRFPNIPQALNDSRLG